MKCLKFCIPLFLFTLISCNNDSSILLNASKYLIEIQKYADASDASYYIEYKNGIRHEGILLENSNLLKTADTKTKNMISSVCAVLFYSSVPDSIFNAKKIEIKIDENGTPIEYLVSDLERVLQGMNVMNTFLEQYNNSADSNLLENFDENYKNSKGLDFISGMSTMKEEYPSLLKIDLVGFKVDRSELKILTNFNFSDRIFLFEETISRNAHPVQILNMTQLK